MELGNSNVWGRLGAPAEVVMPPPHVATKQAIRQRVWEFMERHDIAAFPRPVYHRIPNFRGAVEAGANLVTALPEMAAAKTVEVGPDKPQEEVRLRVLAAGKALVVPTPRLASGGLFNRLVAAPGASADDVRRLASRQGIDKESKPIPTAARLKIDVVVVGAVAVDVHGRRLGKGEGFADLEFAMAASNGSVSPSSTLVCCTVHDCQVLDHLPEHLFGPHDVPVDVIATPTRVIRVERRLPKPTRILWNMLTREKFAQVGVLKEMQFKERRSGVDVRLAEDLAEGVALEEKSGGRQKGERGAKGQQGKNKRATNEAVMTTSNGTEIPNGHANTTKSKDSNASASAAEAKTAKRSQGRKKEARQSKANNTNGNASAQHSKEGSEEGVNGSATDDEKMSRRQQQQQQQQRKTIFLGRIPRSCRAKELKDAMSERGVDTTGGLNMVWKGGKGFAFLNLDERAYAVGHDEVLRRLAGIRLRGQALNVRGDDEEGGGGGKGRRRRKEGDGDGVGDGEALEVVGGIVEGVVTQAASRAES